MLQQSEEQQHQVLGERGEQQNAKTHDNRVTMARSTLQRIRMRQPHITPSVQHWDASREFSAPSGAYSLSSFDSDCSEHILEEAST
jgi:hypothetical protein